MAEHILGGDPGIDAKLLGQVSEASTNFVFLLEEVDLAQKNTTAVRFLECSQGPHESGFARSIRAEQAVHSSRDRQRHVIECLDSIFISLGKVADLQFHGHVSLIREWFKISF